MFDGLKKKIFRLGRRIKSSIVHKAFGKRKTVLIIGSNTSFGQDLSKLFEKEWNVYELDYPDTIVSLSAAKIPKLSDPIKKFSIDLNNLNIAETESQIEESMKDIGTKFEAIICITHEDVLCYPNSHIKDEYIFSDANKCLLENSYKQILASKLAHKALIDDGLLLFGGQYDSFEGCSPNLLGDVFDKSLFSYSFRESNDKILSDETTTFSFMLDSRGIETTQIGANAPKLDSKYQKLAGKIVKGWADGKARPINLSMVHLSYDREKIFPLLK